MRVCLISAGEEIRGTCEVVAQAMPSIDMVAVKQFHPDIKADLFVWDLGPGKTFPVEVIRNDGRHVAAADAASADSLRSTAPGVTVLLKPVTQDKFRSCLSELLERSRAAQSTVGEARRQLSFVARAAREFRSSLNALKGYCGLLLDRNAGGSLTATQTDVVERMHDSLRYASRIADGLWSAEIDSEAEMRGAAVDECLRGAVRDAKFILETREVTVQLLAEDFENATYFAPVRLRHVLLAAIEYACLNSCPGSRVDITAYPAVTNARGEARRRVSPAPADSYRVDIRDSGPGLSPGEVAELFNEDVTLTPRAPRTGSFGLVIAKRIVTALGGRVSAQSTGTGVTVSVVMPCVPNPPAAAFAVAAEQAAPANVGAIEGEF